MNGMEDDISKLNLSPVLPLSALRLLVPPIRLVSAAIWQSIQQKNVADYGILEEFVSMVTDIVPELLTTRQRAQLVLGLRAQLILELCQFDADSELIQPHMDRLQHLIQEWVREAGAESVEMLNFEFVDLIKHLLKNPDEREHFFQKVFPKEFGPRYDEALRTLMWTFLSRLEEFLPLQTFHQVSSMFGEASLVLEECMNSVSACGELKTLLLYQKHLSQLDHNDGPLDGACIISALKLPSVQSSKTQQADGWDKVLSCTSDLERESLTLLHKAQITTVTIAEDQTSDVEARPVRRNRGLRMQTILLEEKRDLGEEVVSAKSAPKKTSNRAQPELPAYEISGRSHMSPISHCSDDDSWSYYSNNNSACCLSGADSWSNYSDEGSVFEPPEGTFSDEDSMSNRSNEDSPFLGAKDVSDLKSSTVKKRVECFICKEHIHTSLRTHMKTHFPTGDYACPRCDSRFKVFTSLKQHLKRTCFEYGQQQVNPENPEAENLYKCDNCDEAFMYKVSLQKHKLTHNELYCSVCRKVLKDAAALARHRVSHTSFQCNRCEETFTLFKPLLRHCQNVHKISKPFRCYQCSKTFSRLRVLIAHEWKHTGHLPFQCEQCGLRVKTDADLISHQRVHTREKPYLCAECGKTFSQRSNLLRHLNLVHGEAGNQKKYACSECDKSFKEKGALKKHQRSKHFDTLSQLFRHPCQYCGKMVSASTIARHRLIHTGERPFKCTMSDCEKHFRSTSEVKRHVLIHHTTERPFKCDNCGKGFVKKCYLNAHSKIHSGEKPFVCHCCGKAFLKLYSMQRHKRLVHTAETNEN
ncbi:zinc finger protein 2-like isoform X2 [Cheilinus undulatus]|uniref:zinc finger protein 2-like isoform X2 n=1 Tax=Cheilinus undulatus TaxID=241271 RepID=UPI001BD35C0F|nr:zinc finger protein 2-like isoform X2 [Cheilinus undulatus]